MTPCLTDDPAEPPILEELENLDPYDAVLENFIEEVRHNLRQRRASGELSSRHREII
jgi:hypothetical protein